MTEQRVQLGVKVPLDWRHSREWRALGCAQAPEAFFSEFGFDYIEFGTDPLASAEKRTMLRSEGTACSESGLGMALHPYLGGPAQVARYDQGPECRRALDRLLEAACDVATTQHRTVPLVFHAAEAKYDPRHSSPDVVRRRLMGVSQRFARDLDERAHRSGGGISVALEHQVPPNPDENLIRTGDTAEELLEVLQGTELSVCWDTGHYLLSMKRHGQSAAPPEEFIDRVSHVHLHDVVDGRDHRPVSEDSFQIRQWIEALATRGFCGRITLEYQAAGIEQSGGVGPVAERSLKLLRQWLGTG